MGSCKILLVTALLVGIASQQSSATRNLHGDHHSAAAAAATVAVASHPEKIISCIGSLGSIVGSFGDVCSGFFGSKLQTLQDALCSSRKDCYGDLLREGAAAYINSVAAKKQAKFAYTTQQVKSCILLGLTSKAAAIEQAALFKKANLACHYT
uniref:Pectinesterase inhibitor domain-containing protein n=1 Tax=Oryza rufipogon TaxID=4529 RepID=A0A0E0PZ26_ORYRU